MNFESNIETIVRTAEVLLESARIDLEMRRRTKFNNFRFDLEHKFERFMVKYHLTYTYIFETHDRTLKRLNNSNEYFKHRIIIPIQMPSAYYYYAFELRQMEFINTLHAGWVCTNLYTLDYEYRINWERYKKNNNLKDVYMP